MTDLLLRLRALFRQRELDQDLEAELAHHLEMKQRGLVEDGSSAAAARIDSRRALGICQETGTRR